MRCVVRLAAVTGVLLLGHVAKAAPRDEVLRVAPVDTAFVFLLQDARLHVEQLSDSPFAKWFPSTTIGKKILESDDLKLLRQSSGMILNELGTTTGELLDEIVGDAVLFAFSAAPATQPHGERAIIIIRPRKPDVLERLIDKANEIQSRSGEVKMILRKEHRGVAYRERRKVGASEFYCFRNQLFLFSTFEAEIKAAIDRDLDAEPASQKKPHLLLELEKLDLAASPLVAIIHPRALDAEMRARHTSARPDEKRFLNRLIQIWTALDLAAVDLSCDQQLELAVTLRFQPDKLMSDARKWLTGARGSTIAEGLIPTNALVGFSAQIRATELLDFIASIAPTEPGKADVKSWMASTIGPIVGRDKLSLVLDALGPNWAAWAEPPGPGGVLPTFVAAIEITGDPETRAKATQSLQQTLDFGFTMARVAYNTTHLDADQMEVKKAIDAATGQTITSLINEKGFPPGFSPSFAVVQGYLVITTAPDAISRFQVPRPEALPPRKQTIIARFSGVHSREYLAAQGPHLARFLVDVGVGPEQPLRDHLAGVASVLELIDSLELIVSGQDDGLRMALRVTPAKPLKK